MGKLSIKWGEKCRKSVGKTFGKRSENVRESVGQIIDKIDGFPIKLEFRYAKTRQNWG